MKLGKFLFCKELWKWILQAPCILNRLQNLKNNNHSCDTSGRNIVEHWLSAAINGTIDEVNCYWKYSTHKKILKLCSI